jgi:hypothetical protein
LLSEVRRRKPAATFLHQNEPESVISRVSVAIEVGDGHKGRCVVVIDETGSEILQIGSQALAPHPGVS